MLKTFGMNYKTKPVYLTFYLKLSSFLCHSKEECEYIACVLYTSVVNGLIYAIVCTSYDISQALSTISRYMHNLGKNHWLNIKWILRFLYRIVNVGLLFKKDCGK